MKRFRFGLKPFFAVALVVGIGLASVGQVYSDYNREQTAILRWQSQPENENKVIFITPIMALC